MQLLVKKVAIKMLNWA